MSIDTEGSEYEILKTFPFDKYTVSCITVEHGHETEKRNNIKSLLESNGYVRVIVNDKHWDDYYIRRINSFDLFDTLVFRKFGLPETIFKQIEINVPNFTKNRKKAEQLSNKTLEDMKNLQKYTSGQTKRRKK